MNRLPQENQVGFSGRVVHASYSRGRRGGAQQTIVLVRELAERGIPQTVLCAPDTYLEKTLTNVMNVETVPARVVGMDGLRALRGTIWHAHDKKAVYSAWVSHLRFGTPYLVTRHDLNPLSRRFLPKAVYRRAAAVIGVSDAVCKLTFAETGRRACRIFNAHRSLRQDAVEVARIRREISGNPIIGQVATLDINRKGQHHLIAAFSRIKQSFPNARLVLMGAGPDEAALSQQAESVGGVVFAGFRPNIADWTAALDLMVYPSKMDALASSLLDAMYLKVPIVANRVGGIPEIAKHGERALLVERGDVEGLAEAAINLLTHQDLKQRLVDNAYLFSLKLTGEAMASAYADLYTKIHNRDMISIDDNI